MASSSPLQIATTSPLPAAKVGAHYSVTVAANGGSKYKWSLVSSALPKGLKLDKKTGMISGKPKRSAVGTDSFEVQVSSGLNATAAIFSISVM